MLMDECCGQQLKLPFKTIKYVVQQLVTIACENGQDYVEEYEIGRFDCREEAYEYCSTLNDVNTKYNLEYEVIAESFELC